METSFELLLAAGLGCRPEWRPFFVASDEPRVHIRFEQADAAEDYASVALLLAGKREKGAAADPALAGYLRWHAAQTADLFEWKTLCAADGCAELATHRCRRCRAARYCGLFCQTKDWRGRHRAACRPAPGAQEGQ